ncbi:hypothetical protein HGRIS_003380 [Hohenbuehelia grisea]|uniref:DUF6830 domain-containing protein n=1 Tax=Hohenbuehelia grisea TaxID=104357 RepID=A0ABR3JFQ1_9AGAR
MIDWLTRRERTQAFDNALTIFGPDRKVRLPKPTLALTLAKTPNATKTIHSIAIDHHAPFFHFCLSDFLNCIADKSIRKSKSDVPSTILPFESLDVWYLARMLIDGIADDSLAEKDQIRASPPSPTDPQSKGRFDTVVVMSGVEAQSTGVAATKVARVKVIFKLPRTVLHLGYPVEAPAFWPQEPLAYVEWFGPPKSRNNASFFYSVRPEMESHPRTGRLGGIIPFSRIRQTCMLVPKWDEISSVNFSSETVLDQNIPFIINNVSSSFAFQLIW